MHAAPTLFVLLLLTAMLCAVEAGAETPWFTRALVGLEIGPTGAQFSHSDPTDTRYCARFDGREQVRLAAAAHAEYLVLWVRDGDYAYYQSKLLPVAPGLGERDPLRDAVDEARRRGLTLIAYCVVQQGGHFLAAHPEWEMRGPDGRPLGRFCYNSGYLEAMKAILAEQLAYGIDGFHIDMLDQGFGPPYGCWCDVCKAQFERDYGHPMPAGATWDAAWDDMLEFRYRSSERFEQALTAYIKGLNAAASVDFNYHGNPPFSFEVGQRPVQHAGNADFVTGETGIWGFSTLGVGLNAAFYRAATPGERVQVAINRGVRIYHDQTTRPLNDLRWELLTLLAHGAFVTVIDKLGFDGGLDPTAYRVFGAAFDEARAKREHFGQPLVQEVGLYYSSRSRDWIGREDFGRWVQSFQGAHRACVLEHLPYGIVLDENVDPATLEQFKMVVLPNVGIVSEREVALLREYVERGGRLIVTGHGGQFDRLGAPLAESPLQDLIGARATGRLEANDNWVRLVAADALSSALTAGIVQAEPPGVPLLVEGPATIYQPTSAQPLGELLRPHRTTRQREGREGTDWPLSADAPVGPAVLVNRVGQGVVLTFAASPDFATAYEHPVIEARELLANAIRWLHPNPRVQISAPANVEAVVTDDPATRTLRVHLLGYNPTPQETPARNRPYVLPGLIEDAPMYRAAIELAVPPEEVQVLGRSTAVRREGGRLELVVEDIHEVVVVRY